MMVQVSTWVINMSVYMRELYKIHLCLSNKKKIFIACWFISIVGLTYYTEVLLHYAFVHVYNYEIMFLFIILIFWGIIIWFKKKLVFNLLRILGPSEKIEFNHILILIIFFKKIFKKLPMLISLFAY